MSTRWTIESHDIVTSTMDLARERVRAGAGDGLVVVASEQSAGRGRRGHRWESPRGGLWFSVVLAPRCEVSDAPPLTIAGALSLVAAISDFIPDASAARALLKWPNDVYIAGAKVGGVLGEVAQSAIILGVGVNVNVAEEHLAEPDHYSATSLFVEWGSGIPLASLLERFLVHFDRQRALVEQSGLADVLSDWQSCSYEFGKTVIADIGGDRITGVVSGIREDGALRIRIPDDTERVIQYADDVCISVRGSVEES